MTDTTRNVDLVIRAKNISKKTLSEIHKDIESINKALDDQIEASKRGQGSLKDLDKSYRDLESAMKSLLQQQAVIKQFEGQQQQLVKLQEALGAASTRLREHQAAMEASEKVTKRQQQQLISYQNAVDKTHTALDKQVERLAKTRAEGEALGLTMNDLVGAQNKVLSTGRALSDSYDKQAAAVDNFADNLREANRAADKAAADNQFAKDAQEAAQLVKASEYVNFWVAALEKKDAAERQSAEANQFAKDAEEARRLVAAGEYVNFWSTSLDELDATQKRLANSKSLNEMADDAMAAAKGYTTLGDASKRLIQNNKLLRQSIDEILDPTAKVRSSLGGVEEEVNSLAASIAKIKGPVTDYKSQVNQLAAANKQLASQASGIDAYQKQVEALRAARAEFVANRAAMTQYAASIRSADEPTAEMQAKLRSLEAALASSSTRLQAQVGRTREMRTALREAGIATNDLAGAQQRLVNAARNSVTAMQNLGDAVKKYGTEVEEAKNSGRLFEDGGRTTLSLMQRIRGEVLALAAAYVGLQGAIGLANDSLNASNTKEGIQNQLALSVGDDPKAIAAEYQYIREQADRIGVSFEEAARGYAKFSAAASLAGRGQKEIRYVAESFLEVGRVANLSADNIDGVFKALEQIYSKGKIQAEELRGQLGDRLFGAFEIAAKALKDQYPDLNKAMKDGEVTASQLVAIAEEYRKTVAGRLPTAMESLAANQMRLNSAFFDFKVLIAESGFADQYEKLVVKLTAFLNSDDGRKFAEGLSKAFGAVVTVLTWLLDHLDEVRIALELAFGIKALSMVAALASAISTTLIPALKKLAATQAMAGVEGVKAFGKINTAFSLLVSAFVGWEIGKVLADKFEIVRQLGVGLVIGFQKLLTQLTYYFNVAWTTVSASAKDQLALATKHIAEFLNDAREQLAKFADAAGLDGIAQSLRNTMTKGVAEGGSELEKQLAELKARLQKEMGTIDETGFLMFQDASDKARAKTATPAPIISPTAKPDIPVDKVTGESDADKKAAKEQERLMKRRIALADELVRALEQAEGKIQRNEKLSLEQRLAAIDTEYAKVFRKIDELAKLPGGAEQANQMRGTLQGYVQQLKTQETLKFNQEEMARKEKTINDLLALRAQLLQNIANQLKNGQITSAQAKEANAGVTGQMNPQINAAVESARAFALANKDVFADQTAMDTYLAKLTAISDELKVTEAGLLSVEQINNDIASGLTGSFDAFAKAIAGGENALVAFKQAFLQFVADFLKKIALMIIQQMILNALQMSNPYGAAVGAVVGGVNSAAQKHSGGLVGSGSNGVKVSAPSSWFAGAPKYHEGGIAGLAADEYPAILKRNEEVLTDSDPRNVLNGGLGGATAQPVVQDVTINNLVDAQSFLGAATSTPSGRKLIMNVLQAERSTLKALVT